MKIFTSITVIIASLTFVSCKQTSPETNSSPDASTQSGATVKPYPLETCLVSGKKLGSMGEPYVITHEGQEIKFCCDACEPSFKKAPTKYLAKLKSK